MTMIECAFFGALLATEDRSNLRYMLDFFTIEDFTTMEGKSMFSAAQEVVRHGRKVTPDLLQHVVEEGDPDLDASNLISQIVALGERGRHKHICWGQ